MFPLAVENVNINWPVCNGTIHLFCFCNNVIVLPKNNKLTNVVSVRVVHTSQVILLTVLNQHTKASVLKRLFSSFGSLQFSYFISPTIKYGICIEAEINILKRY
jgi:hypothetical protein